MAGKRKRLIGVVVSDRMNKTRRVDVERLVKHPRYGKYIRRRTKCYAHDEFNQTRVGDRVEIIESRPLSKLKRWVILRIVTRAPRPDEEPTTVEQAAEPGSPTQEPAPESPAAQT